MIDNTIHHHTPEGTTLILTPAGFIPRLGAWLVDMLIRLIVFLVLAFLLATLGDAGSGLLLILYFLVDWFYAVLFEIYRGGQTIGKKQYGIKVCQDDGMAMDWRSSMTRNVLRVADFLPFMFVSALVCMLFNRHSKRLGDMVAGTVVVYVATEKLDFDIPKAPPATPAIPLTFDEQQAILSFAERLDELPKQRQLELAQILQPLTKQHSSEAVSSEIVGFANGIIGQETS